jgi:hypothetical protein
MAMKPVPPQLEHSRSLIGSFGHPPHRAAFSLLLNLIPFIILEHLGVGVDDFSVLGSREVQAGPAQRIGQADGLRHGVGVFATVIENQPRPNSGLAAAYLAAAAEIYALASRVVLSPV